MAAYQGRRARLLLMAVAAGALLWCGWAWWERCCYRRDIAEVRSEIKAGRTGHAVKKLTALLTWKPKADEAAYLLGTCEKALGNPRAASETWARVSPLSSFAPRAIEARIELAIEQGRLADAEKLFTDAIEDPRVDPFFPPQSLLMVYCQEGRVADALRLVEAAWDRLNRAGLGASERAIQLVRLHVFLRLEPAPTGAIRNFVDRAAARAPDDDRVWLAKAHCEIGAGRLDVAERLLEKCMRRRPDDAPIWRARLSSAIARNDVAAARQAARHVRFDEMKPGQDHALTAWIAARSGDLESERDALDRVVAADPGDFTAINRLADLAVQNGQLDRVKELRRQQAEIQRIMVSYRQLDERNQPIRDAAELAHMAIALGQWFEARAYLTLAVLANPDRDDLRSDLARLISLLIQARANV